MNEVKKVNENPDFFNYMTKEEDEEKCHNTEIIEAIDIGENEGKKERNIEVAKNLLKKNMSMKDIMEITELTEEEIIKLKTYKER